MFASNADEVQSELEEFQKALQKIEKLKGEIIVDSQFTTVDNTIDLGRLSDSPEEAMDEARYLATRQGHKLDDNEKLDETISRFFRDFLEKIFKQKK